MWVWLWLSRKGEGAFLPTRLVKNVGGPFLHSRKREGTVRA